MESGTRLGPYEIIEQLGAGGMGEVWLAQDTRLGRKVAIKVLPAEFAADPERVARFEQEARAAAALNHPHIAAVFDIGEHDAGVRYIVQEYLQGHSLRHVLEAGALPLKRALRLGTEIAEALVAAHAAGIIHRDIKPDNVFVTPDGHAKVLDFGLAKLTEATGAPLGGQSMSPTVLGTQAGAIMGTAGYMAPEQVNGEEIDHRADLFAFGCVLYETITGGQPFVGKSVPDTLSRILHHEPESLVVVDESLPFELWRIVKKCLSKEPATRYQTAGDLVVDLQALGADVESGTAMPLGGQPVVAPLAVEETRGVSWKLAASIAVASALLAALGFWITMSSPGESLVRRFDIEYPADATFQSTGTLGVAISPEGSSVVFNANRQLWLRAIDDLTATPIRGTEGARVPFFSPDGQQLGFWGSDGQMKSVAITGGAPVSLGPAPERAYGASWADDGYIYFGQGPGGILRVSENGGEPEVVVELEEGERAHGPQLLPGGEWLILTLLSGSNTWNDASIVAQSLSGGERKLLVAGGTDGRYVPTGHIVYTLEGNLFAVPFDRDSMEVTGGPVSIVEGIQQATSLTGAGQYAFSDRGGLVYIPGTGADVASQLVWVDRNGQIEPLPFEPRVSGYLDLSPDGQRIALEILEDGQWDIWIYEVERGGGQVRLTTEGNNRQPAWSPDGEWVFFSSDRGGDFDIWKRRADRSLDAELVLDTEAPASFPSISADGEMLVFTSGAAPDADVGILALGTEQEPSVLANTAADERQGSFSPDGRFLAFITNETGEYEVYVREVSSGRTFSVSTSTRGGAVPQWSQDGTEIYYMSRVGGPGLLVVRVTTDPFSASEPIELSDIVRRPLTNIDVTAGAQRFLVTVGVGSGDAGTTVPRERLTVVLNWFEELKQRVPTGR